MSGASANHSVPHAGAADPEGHGSRRGEPVGERRREARTATHWIAVIRLLDGTEIPCNVKDVSVSGAKLGVPESVALPDTFMLKVLGRDFVCLVKLVWRRDNWTGVRIERVGKLPSPDKASAPEPRRTTDESGYKSLKTSRSKVSSF